MAEQLLLIGPSISNLFKVLVIDEGMNKEEDFQEMDKGKEIGATIAIAINKEITGGSSSNMDLNRGAEE
ncbi:hypothetical protein R1flu_000968 [Riccia fluitans]|uniref:Uncharacterized protein n=1 Tax=Riccia fluitans TaxID=41844 RepID=A0ABD1Y248_9MARC